MLFFFFFKQKTAYEMRISDWSSDVCSSDLAQRASDMNFDAIDIAQYRGLKRLLHRAESDDAAILEQQHIVRHPRRLAQIVEHEDDACPSPRDIAEPVENIELVQRIETGQRLIRKQIGRAPV